MRQRHFLKCAKLSERARKLAVDAKHDQSFPERARKLAAENSEIIDDDDSKWPHNFRTSRANFPPSRESQIELATTTPTQARSQNGGPRCEYVDVVNAYDFHSASRSSSWKRLFGKSTFYQKSATTNSETIVRCNKQVGQGSERNPRNIRDRLAIKFLEKDDSVD